MALCPCISKGRTGQLKFSWPALEQSTRNKQKPSSSNPVQLGHTKTAGTHFIRNGNRNSLNLWIRDISLSCLPWYWLCAQTPFTLYWLGLNCCCFRSTLNTEPTVVISRTDWATEWTSGTVIVPMGVPGACTHTCLDLTILPPLDKVSWLYSGSWQQTCHESAWLLHWKEYE